MRLLEPFLRPVADETGNEESADEAVAVGVWARRIRRRRVVCWGVLARG